MTWRERLALLLGAASPFAFAGLAKALPVPHGTALTPVHPAIDRDAWVYTDPAEKDRLLLLAGHRSHSSHSSHSSHYSGSGGHMSHSSHSSHYSGSGGHSTSYSGGSGIASGHRRAHHTSHHATTTHALPDTATGLDPAAVHHSKRLTKNEVQEFVRKTQIALVMKGYDPGPADGRFGSKTRAALKKFQEASSLPATGLMDVDTLRRLGVIS
jgi:hypothetical protein